MEDIISKLFCPSDDQYDNVIYLLNATKIADNKFIIQRLCQSDDFELQDSDDTVCDFVYSCSEEYGRKITKECATSILSILDQNQLKLFDECISDPNFFINLE